MNKNFSIDKDAFSNGQIDSKLWLCEELEKLFDRIDNIYIYGGWYGVTAFLLKTRNNIKIKTIRSFDIDPDCEAIADMINENWVYKDWQFKAHTKDCNIIVPENIDLVINTSSEHFDSYSWFDKIPKKTTVALQGNNMPHNDHVIHSKNLKDFCSHFPLSKVYYTGQKEFKYPNWNFMRYMIIGEK